MNASISEIKGACQRCGEHIVFPCVMEGENAKCPHCGLETTLVGSISQYLVRKAPPDGRLEQPTLAGARPVFLIYLIVFLIPIIGFFLGIWLFARNDKGHGAAVTLLSIALMVIYLLIGAAVSQ